MGNQKRDFKVHEGTVKVYSVSIGRRKGNRSHGDVSLVLSSIPYDRRQGSSGRDESSRSDITYGETRTM